MNRQSKRMTQRQGARKAESSTVVEPEIEADDLEEELDPSDLVTPAPSAARRRARAAADSARPGTRQRMTPARFLREVRNELRQVVWPNRSELVNYTTVVFTVLVIMIALIFVLNLAFGKAVLYLFQK